MYSLNPNVRTAVSDPTQGTPPAGWYPDPAGSPQQRWWDGRQWSDALQPVSVTPEPATAEAVTPEAVTPEAVTPETVTPEPVAFPELTSQPIAVAEPVASVFPFASMTASQPIAVVDEQPTRSRAGGPEKSPAQDAAPSTTRGRLQYLALLTLGLVLSLGGLGLFTFGTFVETDPILVEQNQLLGGIAAGFGVFSMLLWLAVGAIRNR